MSPRPSHPLRLEYIILGLVRRDPIHGYVLLRDWERSDGPGIIWRVKPGQFYAALEKLEILGYLTMTPITGETAPLRKEYRITTTGEQAFLDWMNTPVPAVRNFRQDFLAKLFFSKDVDPIEFESLDFQQKVVCNQWLFSLEKQMQTKIGFERQVHAFRLRQVIAILDWLEELPSTS